ncbi:MAG: DUF503 domain-containing protein [Candidatus Omnitrophica bacterium]|nr:DUF503 domain-containing protein [Candidatus Omnitrophota bacterium]
MIIGIVTFDLSLPECHSLKEKRMLLKSLKARLRNQFNISVSEVDWQDKWQRSTVAVAAVGTGKRDLNSMLSHVVESVRSDPRWVILDESLELI